MNKSFISIVCVLLISLMMFNCSGSNKSVKEPADTTTAENQDVQAPQKPKKHVVSCMSFNVLGQYGETSEIPSATVRYPHTVKLLVQYEADILCVQEAMVSTVNWQEKLPKDLTKEIDYDYVSYNSLSGKEHRIINGLFIFYKNEIFELKDSGFHVFSNVDTTDRVFIWAELYDKIAQKTVFVVNTHWSLDDTRTNQAKKMLDFFKEKVKDNVLFACGDFNSGANTEWMQLLCSDIYKNCSLIHNQGVNGVDHFIINASVIDVKHYGLVEASFTQDGQTYKYSDHKPVLIRAKF